VNRVWTLPLAGTDPLLKAVGVFAVIVKKAGVFCKIVKLPIVRFGARGQLLRDCGDMGEVFR
jgi:hypothetical protein